MGKSHVTPNQIILALGFWILLEQETPSAQSWYEVGLWLEWHFWWNGKSHATPKRTMFAIGFCILLEQKNLR